MRRFTLIKAGTALAVCALLVATAGAQGRNSRPFRIEAHSQMVVSLADWTYSATAAGVASHFGKVTMEGWGSALSPIGNGTITAANGDLVGFDFNSATGVVTITGGTGRFDHASGEFTLVSEEVGREFGPGTMTIFYVWTGEGTISY